MNSALKFLTHLISPPYCVGCDLLLSDYTVLCIPCLQALPKIASHAVAVTAHKPLAVHAFTAYRKPIEKLIQAKLHGQRVASYQMGFLLAQHIKNYSLEPDYITPIPLYWYRKLGRGFNQADILAQHGAAALGKNVSHLLKRTKNTAFQSTLSAADRAINLEDAFVCMQQFLNGRLKDKKILLVDDLYTTGATAVAAARELYRQGAASVELLVVCKVVD